MCGITGIIGPGYDHDQLDRMMQRITHRGPDGKGRWKAGDISLGHLRLKIIDLSDRAAQPMVCRATQNILVFNGEIYNYKEIRSELENRYTFQSDSDTEVILAAYAIWGPEAIGRLRGMFAFALYDTRRRATLLVRDRFGIKPLYYRAGADFLLFSSEIKGLINLPGLKHTPNLHKVFGFLAHRHLDTDTQTFFSEISQLPPATYAWVSEKGNMSAPVEYWKPPRPGNRHILEEDLESFRNELRNSINLHLRADVPVSCFLSGGLDSSSIACLAAGMLDKERPLQTYSSILVEKNEENALIDVVRDYLPGCIHHGVVFEGGNFLEELSAITYHHDEPFADASMYVHWELCKLAQSHGTKVMLSGNGGDELLGGYANHLYAQLGRILWQGKIGLWLEYLGRYPIHRPESAFQFFMRSIQEVLPYTLRELQKDIQALPARKLLLGQIKANSYIFYRYHDKDPYFANVLNNLHSWTIPQFLHYEDRNSMAFGIEIRVPMLDHVFWEFVSTYTPQDLLKYRTKQFLRDALKGKVPDPVLKQRLKHGFAAPLERFVYYNKTATIDFYHNQIQHVPFFNQPEIIRLGKAVVLNGDPSRFHYFWRVLSTAIWYNTFFHA
jgi:asparagine synthase (glutamine-hydrolysing)